MAVIRANARIVSSSAAGSVNRSVHQIAVGGVDSRVARTLRIALVWLTALAAACLFSVALFAQTANADVTINPNQATEWSSNVAGAHADVRQYAQFSYNNSTNDDLKNIVIDFPAGEIGDPNAIPSANRCGVDYTGVPASDSPNYSGCPASSQVGDIDVKANSSLCGNLTLSGRIWLLRNRPAADPEVPTRLGITVSGSACLLLRATISMTAEITVRPTDSGLRIKILDDISRTDPIIGGAIRVQSIDQTIYGVADQNTATTADDKPFLTNPTRCDAWNTRIYARSWDNNAATDATIDGLNYASRTTPSTNVTPTCTGMAAFAPTFSLTQTNTQAGRPVGLRAVVTNPGATYNANQPSYAKSFSMALPVGFKINPAIANRLGAVGCTEAQFRVPAGTDPISNGAPACPTGSQIGTVAVKVPEITGDLIGKLFLGDPQAGDSAAGIYRLYIWAARGGVVVKFEVARPPIRRPAR